MTEDPQGAAPPPRRADDGFIPGRGSLALPRRFGPYVVEDRIARGGMGAVLLVRHERLGAPYALKVIPDAQLDPVHLIRFEREIQALVALSGHPHIVAVHACGVEGGRPWYVMDRIEGLPLDKLLAAKGALSIKAALRLGVQLASALDAAHARGVLHRDMKPANVLVVGDLETPEGRAVLCDFGLATIPDGTLTKTGDVLGTPAFLAPEQALGDRQRQGPPTDIFGLGAVLYFALTRERPFGKNSMSAMSALAAVLHDKLRPPRRLRPEIPEALEAVLVRCLEKETERRYAHARELRADLERILSGSAKPAAPRRVPGAVLLGVGLLVLAALAVGAAVAIHRLGPRPLPARPEDAHAPPLVEKPAAVERTPPAPSADDAAAAEALLPGDPVAAVKRRLGDRIEEDGELRRELAAFVLRAAAADMSAEGAAADERLSLIAESAAKAGLDVPPLVAAIDSHLIAGYLLESVKPTGKHLEVGRRLALAAFSLRGSRPDVDRGLEEQYLVPAPPEVPDVDVCLDHHYALAESDLRDSVQRARWLAQQARPEDARRMLGVAEQAGASKERVASADLELRTYVDPVSVADELGADDPKEPFLRRITRAQANANCAIALKDAAREKLAVAILRRILDEEAANKKTGHYAATRACMVLVEIAAGLGRRHAARAWLARGRFALGGGGASFDDWRAVLFKSD